MRKLAVFGSIVALAGTLAWADTTTTPVPTGKPGGTGPCKQIEAACTSAGFVKGEAKEGKGLFKDCVGPIVHGQTVTGVTVDPAVAAACQQRMAKRHQMKQQGGTPPNGMSSGGGAPPAENSSPQ